MRFLIPNKALIESVRAALDSVLEQVERVAPTGSTVLIQGETGYELPIRIPVRNTSTPPSTT